VRFQQTLNSIDKIVDIRDMSEGIVGYNQISLTPLSHQLLCKACSKEVGYGRYTLLFGELGDICSWFDSDCRHSKRPEMLQKIAVIASSTTKLSVPSASRSLIISQYAFACATHDVEYDDK
jgi:hypothetical protein